ncbi:MULTISPECIES: polyphenol oxidase family protein [Actinomyces]|uniref:Laccase domain-containing protein n=1 Tax=Actinomyces respiraculi TaxID=2744574 RepID=A0A7T0LN78_9ACTO|nr:MULTISPECIES: polyphenol oxidase family protein [Actinomyces]QPL06273.1 laccase domain-containing protein [Actinomyces respiraculi]
MTATAAIELLKVGLGPGARGFFTTRGAGAPPVSGTDPYAGTNLALHVGDDENRVLAHRRALAHAIAGATGAGAPTIAWMNQVHSTVVATVAADASVTSLATANEVPTADALVLDLKHGRAPAAHAAAVMVADCVPLLLATGDGTLTAAVHAGRRGMLDGVVPAAIDTLTRRGADPADLWAAVGPCVCGSCYEVPEQLRDDGAAIEPACATTTRWGTPGLDVAAGVIAQLTRLGVRRIEHPGWCTLEEERFYSYRRDGRTGRLAGVVVGRQPPPHQRQHSDTPTAIAAAPTGAR